jgi:hypothetical protein
MLKVIDPRVKADLFVTVPDKLQYPKGYVRDAELFKDHAGAGLL